MAEIDKIAIIITVIVTSFFVDITVFMSAFQSHSTNIIFAGVSLDIIIQIIAIITPLTIGAVTSTWFTIKYLAKRSIKSAINKMEESFEDNKKVSFIHPVTKQKFKYLNRKMTTTPFDSIVSSGAFKHFSIELQNALDNLYSQIKYRNEVLEELGKIHDQIRIIKPTHGGARDVMIEKIVELHLVDKHIPNNLIITVKSLI